MAGWEAGYRSLLRSGELEKRAAEAMRKLACCGLCPKRCEVDRTRDEVGTCRGGSLARVSSYGPHFGEEDVLVGEHGSGTIFFAGCNLSCVFCQNYDISREGRGEEVTPEELAEFMRELEGLECHNINFVSPTHYLPQILAALVIAARGGLNLPLVYNCGGYESLEALHLLDGVIDIYMPDFKYGTAETGRRLSGVRDYPAVVQAAVREMHRQVGDLVIEDGLARRGLLVRHLVLPGGLADTQEVARFLAEEISPHTYVNIMGQYYPAYRAWEYEGLDRPVRHGEWVEALEMAREAGLHRFAR